MSHVRQQIREYVSGELGLVDVTEIGRVHGLAPEDMPLLNLATPEETSEQIKQGAIGTLQRTVQVQVQIHLAAAAITDNVYNLIDDICVQIENRLGPGTWNGLISPNAFLASTSIQLTGEGEKRTGVATLTYAATYMTQEDNSEVAV